MDPKDRKRSILYGRKVVYGKEIFGNEVVKPEGPIEAGQDRGMTMEEVVREYPQEIIKLLGKQIITAQEVMKENSRLAEALSLATGELQGIADAEFCDYDKHYSASAQTVLEAISRLLKRR